MALTPRLRAEREVEELWKSIRQMFRHLASLKLTAEDRAATVRGIEAAARPFDPRGREI
jgi:hypothetical protein